MGHPDHGNGTVEYTTARPHDSAVLNTLREQNAVLQKAVYLLHEQLQKIEEQQAKDSAELTEIAMVLNELLPYARRAAAMLDKNPLMKLRTAMGKNNGSSGA